MKIIKEYINEKFEEKSDPIQDMNIGLKRLIQDWLNKYEIKHYIINRDYTIDLYSHALFLYKDLYAFPDYINFNETSRDFSIQYNRFKSLRGCPKIVGGMFSCSNNLLRSLEYAPLKAHDFYCHSNAKRFTKQEVLKYCDVKKNIVT